MIVPSTGMRVGRGGQSAGAGTSCGHLLPLAGGVERANAERGVDGEDLPVADVADGAGLGDLVADDGEGHVDVEDLALLRVLQVLRRRPDARPPRGALHGGDGRAQAAAAEEEAAAVITPGVTSSDQRNGLWLGRRPRNERESIGAGLYAATAGPTMPSKPHHGRSGANLARMTIDTPWSGDACSLVDAYRRGERSPAEELAATLGGDRALASSTPSASSTRRGGRGGQQRADVSLPVRRRADRREGAGPRGRLAVQPRQRRRCSTRSATSTPP